jgi:hypothetical protein
MPIGNGLARREIICLGEAVKLTDNAAWPWAPLCGAHRHRRAIVGLHAGCVACIACGGDRGPETAGAPAATPHHTHLRVPMSTISLPTLRGICTKTQLSLSLLLIQASFYIADRATLRHAIRRSPTQNTLLHSLFLPLKPAAPPATISSTYKNVLFYIPTISWLFDEGVADDFGVALRLLTVIERRCSLLYIIFGKESWGIQGAGRSLRRGRASRG